MKSLRTVLSGFFVVALLSGCIQAVKEGASPGIHVDDEMVKIRMNSVVILDRELQVTYVNESSLTGTKEYGHASKISVESSGARRTATGTAEVWAILRNRTNYPQQVECNVQFFDRSGAPVEGPTAWQRLVLSPNSVSSYKEFSTNTIEGVNYYIQVREGR
jgi:uncharacterized protein DUF1425